MNDDDKWFVSGPWFSQPPHGDSKTPHWIIQNKARTMARFFREEDAVAVVAALAAAVVGAGSDKETP